MLLKVDNLTVHYGKAVAVQGVSMEVEEGSVVSLVGANGAGKTTILRTLSGLVPSTSGEIWFRDRRIDGLPVPEIVRLGLVHVPQGRHLFPHLTVLSNLKLGASLRKDREGTEEDLEKVFRHFPRLRERVSQKAGTLSGGEQQMVAIGRALMARPRLLLLDEPSLGLAPLVVEDIMAALLHLRKEGLTILLVEQNARAALKVADRAYVLETGRIILTGSAGDLLEDRLVTRAYLGRDYKEFTEGR